MSWNPGLSCYTLLERTELAGDSSTRSHVKFPPSSPYIFESPTSRKTASIDEALGFLVCQMFCCIETLFALNRLYLKRRSGSILNYSFFFQYNVACLSHNKGFSHSQSIHYEMPQWTGWFVTSIDKNVVEKYGAMDPMVHGAFLAIFRTEVLYTRWNDIIAIHEENIGCQQSLGNARSKFHWKIAAAKTILVEKFLVGIEKIRSDLLQSLGVAFNNWSWRMR